MQMVLRSTVVMMFVQNVDEIAFDAGKTRGEKLAGHVSGRGGEVGRAC